MGGMIFVGLLPEGETVTSLSDSNGVRGSVKMGVILNKRW